MQTHPETAVATGPETAVEGPYAAKSADTRRSAAFGLALEVDAAIEVPGIADSDIAGSEVPAAACDPPTHVALDPEQLRWRWSRIERDAECVRELRDGSETLLSVELAPRAGYLLHAPGFARILVSPDGVELLCDPAPEQREWTALLCAQALPLAATLRGLEVLHASGTVSIGERGGEQAMLFSGPQGAGKSSLAAALLRRGATLLSDDAVALEPREGKLIAYPGAAVMNLRSDEHERLSAAERELLGPTEAALGKQRYRPGVSAAPAPLGGLFLLERAGDGPPVERLEAVDPFALLASTFNLSVRTPERLARHLDLCVALAKSGRVYRLRTQPGIDATQLAEILGERLPEL